MFQALTELGDGPLSNMHTVYWDLTGPNKGLSFECTCNAETQWVPLDNVHFFDGDHLLTQSVFETKQALLGLELVHALMVLKMSPDQMYNQK